MASPFTPPTIPGAQGYPLGLTGATSATRYVGATASGAPASGTFAVGDFVVDQSGVIYVCTVAGSPGTWASAGIGPAIIDAKGDLIAGTAADTAARLAVGANGTVLAADSAQATGLAWLGFLGARVYNTADQLIANNTATPITFDSERFDTSAFHSTSSNTSRLTIPTGLGGYYLIGGGAQFDGHATGIRVLQILLNGTTPIANQGKGSDDTADYRFEVATLYALAAADYVELTVYQNSGGNLNLDAEPNAGPEFWCARLGV